MALWSRRISLEWPLRLGLGLTYLYSGYSLVAHPTSWYWAVFSMPQGLQDVIGRIGIDTYLRIQGSVELFLAAVFLLWFLPRFLLRLAAFLATLQMVGILLLVGVRGDTFRDIAILGAATALFLSSLRPSALRTL